MSLIHDYERNVPVIGEKVLRVEVEEARDNYQYITIYFDGGKHVTISTYAEETKKGIVKDIHRGNIKPEIKWKSELVKLLS